jgi:hypothetical protein
MEVMMNIHLFGYKISLHLEKINNLNWNAIFNPDDFLDDMIKIGEINKEDFENNEPYGMMVTKLCIFSCNWMYNRVKKYNHILDNLYIVHGSYNVSYDSKLGHSWVEYRIKDEPPIIIDLTVSQFRDVRQNNRLYISSDKSKYNENFSCSFSDNSIKDFIDNPTIMNSIDDYTDIDNTIDMNNMIDILNNLL